MGNTSTKNSLSNFWNNCMATFRMTGGIQLWRNLSPTSSFATQTITLSQSMDNFQYIIIVYFQGVADGGLQTQYIQNIPNVTGQNVCFTRIQYSYDNATKLCERRFYKTSSTTILAGDCYANGAITDTDNVPVAIYGSNDLGYVGSGEAIPAHPSATQGYILAIDENGELTWIPPYDGGASGN